LHLVSFVQTYKLSKSSITKAIKMYHSRWIRINDESSKSTHNLSCIINSQVKSSNQFTSLSCLISIQ